MSITEKQRAQNTKYYLAHREELLEKVKAYQKENLKVNIESSRRYAQRNRKKRAAYDAVQYAIKTGKLTKKPCHCGKKKAEAHHENYNEPLLVVWLCVRHHNELHYGKKDSYGSSNDCT